MFKIGAEELLVEFDRQCSTERRHDPLVIMDPSGKTLTVKSGREWSDWCCPVIVQGNFCTKLNILFETLIYL